jgi:hypothetical protein
MKLYLSCLALFLSQFLSAQWCYNPGASNTASTSPSAILSDDFNNDGKMDVLVGVFNRVYLFTGNGAGAFTSSVVVNTSGQIISIASAHLNADPYKDFIFLIQSGNAMVALGSSSGSFSIAGGYPGCASPLSVLTEDFNNDNLQDLIITDGCSAAFHRYIGNGTGGFATATSSILITNGGSSSTDGVAADFNNDGLMDLIHSNGSTKDVSVYLGAPGSSFQAVTKFTVGTNPMSIDKGDFNLDGKLDIATANNLADSVAILFGNGSGGFSAATFYKVNANPRDIKVADLNGDGYLDLAVSNYSANNICVLPGTSGGLFLSPLNFTTGLQPSALALADFNGDNRFDMVSANRTANTISTWLSNYPAPIITGNATLCVNSTATFSATNVGTNTFSWSTGSNASQIQFPVLSNTVLTLSATNSLNCIGTSTLAITALPQPTLNISSSASVICKGESVLLTGSGATTYTWNNGISSPTLQLTLTGTTNFTLNGSGSNGCVNKSVWSQSVSACTQLSNTAYNAQDLRIFPNPASEFITIQTDYDKALELNIYNALGERVMHETVSDLKQINIAHLPKGFYVYTLSSLNQFVKSGPLVLN